MENSQEQVNGDPYGSGWLIKIDPSDLSEKDELMDSDSYEKFVGWKIDIW